MGSHYAMTESLEDNGAASVLTLRIDYTLPFGPVGRLAGKLGAERRALDEAQQVVLGIASLAEPDTPAAQPSST